MKTSAYYFRQKEEQIFLGRDFTQAKDYSEQTAIEIDSEIRRILRDAYERAERLLRANLDAPQIDYGLLEKEVLEWTRRLMNSFAASAQATERSVSRSPRPRNRDFRQPSVVDEECPMLRLLWLDVDKGSTTEVWRMQFPSSPPMFSPSLFRGSMEERTQDCTVMTDLFTQLRWQDALISR